jgi:hypothetical protein
MQKLAEASSAGRAIQTGCVPKKKFVAHVWSPYGQNRPRTACRRTDIWASAGADLGRHQSAFSGVLARGERAAPRDPGAKPRVQCCSTSQTRERMMSAERCRVSFKASVM